MSRKHPKNQGGRPTKLADDIVTKLTDGISNGLTIREACVYAGISHNAFYEWLKTNPGFNDKIEDSKLLLNLIARKTLKASLSDPQYAWRYLERKDPDLKPITKVEHAGKIQTEDVTELNDPDIAAGTKAFKEAMAKARAELRKQKITK